MSDTRPGRGLKFYEAPVFIEGQWIARMPADYACRIVTGSDEMKWNEMNEMSVEKWRNKICVGENGRNLEKNIPRSRFHHLETHMESPRRELGTPGLKGEEWIAFAMI